MPTLGPKRLYEPVSRCIYCRGFGKDGEKLGDEHIIPLSFGGSTCLPEASCRECEAVTTKFEDHCVKGLISTARPHLGIRGRQKSRFRDRGPVYLDDRRVTSVPLNQHPGALMIPVMPFPALLAGVPLPQWDNDDIPPAIRLVIRPMTPDIAQRAWQINRGGLNLTKGQSAIEFYRFVAKIAYSFTVAELGLGGFENCLINLIFLQRPMFADYVVGSGLIEEPPKDILHEISFDRFVEQGSYEHIVVRLRLFSYLAMPVHYIVSGRRKKL